MSSLSKMLNILNLFGSESFMFDVDSIASEMDLSRATAYRYVKELCESGLLIRVEGCYTLGPRIIELDWMMRQYDPLISYSKEAVVSLSKATGLTVFISAYYDGRIINTHSEPLTQQFGFSFGRGQPLPLFKGAQSKVLVSFQKTSRLKRLFEELIEPNNEYDYTWRTFSQITRSIRQDGFCVTHDELNLGLTGVSAPIFNGEGSKELLGSIAAVGDSSSFELLRSEAVVDYVKKAAETIGAKIAEEASDPIASNINRA